MAAKLAERLEAKTAESSRNEVELATVKKDKLALTQDVAGLKQGLREAAAQMAAKDEQIRLAEDRMRKEVAKFKQQVRERTDAAQQQSAAQVKALEDASARTKALEQSLSATKQELGAQSVLARNMAKELEAANAKLTAAVANTQQAHQQAEVAVARVRQEMERKLTDMTASTEQDQAMVKARLADLAGKYETAKADAAALKRSLAAVQQKRTKEQLASEKAIAQMVARLEKSASQADGLRARSEKLEVQLAELGRVEKALRAQQKEMGRTHQQGVRELTRVHAAQQKVLENQLADVTAKLSKADKGLAKQNTAAQESIAQLQAELDVVRGDAAARAMALSAAKAEAEKRAVELRERSAEQHRLAEAREKAAALKIAGLESQFEKERAAEQARSAAEYKSMKKALAGLESETTRHERTSLKLQETLAETSGRLDESLSALKAEQQSREAVLAAAKTERAALEKAVAASRRGATELQRAHDKQLKEQASISARQVSALVEGRQRAESDVVRLESELKALREALEGLSDALAPAPR